MKKVYQVVALLIIVLLYATNINAKILRVGFSGPAVAGVDYTNVSAAIAAAAVDDTIQLYQNASVGNATVNKRLVLLGFGYLLERNPGYQAVPTVSNFVSLVFVSGSEGTIVHGLLADLQIAANNITISRCHGSIFLGYNNGTTPSISNTTITNSFLNLYGYYGIVSNALISNCIFLTVDLPNVSGLFSNNIMATAANWRFGSCVIKNNIFAVSNACASGTSAVFQNNLFARNDNCGTPITGSNNQFNVNMANVFANWNNGNFGSETNLALAASSPAINFGVDGNGNPTNAGIYGGEPGLVYKPSGIPAIPAIYQLTAPGLNATTNPYTITVSVRSNN